MRCLVVAILMLGLGLAVGRLHSQDAEGEKNWALFEISELLQQQRLSKRAYLPFLKVPALNCGVYVLEKEAVDRQKPHTQDEVYYVVEGQGRFEVGADDLEVKPGSVLYVKAGVEHRFHHITQDIKLLVFFSAAKK